MDGFGITMFLPLLELISSEGAVASSEQLGNLSFLADGIMALGLDLTLTVVLLFMLGFFVLKGFFTFLEGYMGAIYGQFFIRNLRENNIMGLANFSFNNFVNADAGRIQSTISSEVNSVSAGFSSYMQVLKNIVLLIVYTVLAFYANPEFALLVAVGGVLTNFVFNRLYKITKRLSSKVSKDNHTFHRLLIQQVGLFKYLKATGLIRQYAHKLIDQVKQIENSNKRMGILNAFAYGLKEPLMIGVVVVVILVQVNLMGGQLGLIVLSILLFYRALSAVMGVQTAWNNFLRVHGALNNMTLFMDELHVGRDKEGQEDFSGFNTAIRLEGVSFAYGDTTILNNINLHIQKNESIAFVGESGSGKTTLLNILCGLLQPADGKMFIDNADISKMNVAQYQKRIGYITQEPVVFNDTVFNNVTFWDDKTPENMQRFEHAMRQASIYQYIQDQDDKEDARLGNNGINLSGGQKQRISIARELYKDVDFLFLDEATSALDSETEKMIQESLDNLRGKYTIVTIAHRLSTIKNADRVVVLNKGEIEGAGTYKALIKQSVAFKRMVALQEV